MKTFTSFDKEIFIVEDYKMVSFLLEKAPEKFNFNSVPHFLGNGKETLDFLAKNAQNDLSFLILVDLHVSVMNCWEFLERCKELGIASKIAVVVMTSYVNKEDLYRALNYKNVVGFSTRPLKELSMKATLEFTAVKNFFIEMEYQALENDLW